MPINKNTPVGTVVKDFEKSKAPQFSGKSKEKRREMGIAAALHAHNPKGTKKKSKYENNIGEIHAVLHPHEGCTVAGMVKEIDPLQGLAPHSIVAEDVHSLHPSKEKALKEAEKLHDLHLKKLEEIEKKKDLVAKKITGAIDNFEKKRKEHVDLAKSDPSNANSHKDKIAHLATKIDDLMSKLERVERSKKHKKDDDKTKKSSKGDKK
jgi:hypothetical protein